jgi:hypothetical protein
MLVWVGFTLDSDVIAVVVGVVGWQSQSERGG